MNRGRESLADKQTTYVTCLSLSSHFQDRDIIVAIQNIKKL